MKQKGVISSIAAGAATPTLQSQILGKAVALLGRNAHRTRMSSFKPAELPAFNVFPEDGEAEYVTTDQTDRTFRFNVRCMAASVDAVDVTVDAVYLLAVKSLLADPTFGGLCRRVTEGKQRWEFEKGEAEIVALVVTFEAQFSTSRSDPSVAGY